MCVTCEGSTYDDEMAELTRAVEQDGWAVRAVFEHGLRAPWAYTVGLTRFGRPELVVTGLDALEAADLLNEVALLLVETDEAPRPGSRIPATGGVPVEFVEVAAPDEHLVRAVALHGEGVRAVQVVWSDERGHWPWQRSFRSAGGGQPVLGPRARDAPPLPE